MIIRYQVGEGWTLDGKRIAAPFLKAVAPSLTSQQRALLRQLRAEFKGSDLQIEKRPGIWWGVRVYAPPPFEAHVQTSRRTLRAAVHELVLLKHRRRE